ncbi:MAG: glycosyl hydrolase [Candidatus Marinimicrobia bacterium]|nr:glycosyl hydrolase [Candidatus Neomarinimicrobiota bacterium]MBL7011163.1 glycosyl hydrolase [Candidatus Neomarinimicrobiota bacterium]MBL7031313.1 glycosyl hydrolase [Candidatus Neomarinimicrobiota bacterium]
MIFLLASLTLVSAKERFSEDLYKALKYRNIGPFRGGRSAAAAGVPGNKFLAYFGATGGGVWQTKNGGQSWENISDEFFGGSIGAVAVSEWDPNVIYVGGGEVTVRGNVSHGDGVWKSNDAGKTWKHMGLKDSRRIPRIRIHPRNPDLVYAAALGHLFGPNEERGVFRSKDGGESWEKILYVNDEVGACDLTLDPNNPRIIYASTWRIKRTPYSLESGGEGSGLWKSTDGGDTWEDITHNKGLPEGMVGIIGVTISPLNSDRIWAMIENSKGGLFRSDDGGKTWIKTSSDNNLRQRAWYYTRVYADTENEDIVYVLNVSFWRSKDGGKTFNRIRTPHGDHHDLWIDPQDAKHLIIADDGGGQVSFDAGATWSTYHNQPTSQFYRVDVDNQFPYRIYAGQQDNSTVSIPSRTSGGSITEDDWHAVGGGESAHVAPHPENPNIVYAGSYSGFLTRYDHVTKERRNITVWPDNPMGHGVKDMKFRFQWNFPIEFDPFDPNTLYVGSQHLHRSTDEGQSWEVISPDLTTNTLSMQDESGGPITKDDTGVEYYCTVFVITPSPQEEGVIWIGTDDGRVHITKNGGQSWDDITPKNMPEWGMVNSIDQSAHDPATAYMAVTRYKSDDFKPYLFKTSNYGKSWKMISRGIPDDAFTRVVREDPERKGLLYAGTETGMYISFDDGKNWQSFQLNLPIVPITDLAVKENDLVVGTQGRSFWILDDLTPLHQLTDKIAKSNSHLYQPRVTYRMGGGSRWGGSSSAGANPPNGVMTFYYLKDEISKDDTITLEYIETNGDVIKTFSNIKDKKKKVPTVDAKKGMNRFVWDTRYPDAKKVPKAVMWGGSHIGPKAVPGEYKVRMTVNGKSQTQSFIITKDPRLKTTQNDFQAQFDLLIDIRDKTTEINEKILTIRSIKKQVKTLTDLMEKSGFKNDDLLDAGKALVKKFSGIEEELIQVKSKSGQDPLNYPIKLDNKIAALVWVVSGVDARPTAQSYGVLDDLVSQAQVHYKKLDNVLTDDLFQFNNMVREAAVPAVMIIPSEMSQGK